MVDFLYRTIYTKRSKKSIRMIFNEHDDKVSQNSEEIVIVKKCQGKQNCDVCCDSVHHQYLCKSLKEEHGFHWPKKKLMREIT